MEARDAEAIFTLGCIYSKGLHGMPQNHTKALELWRRAGELGHADSYCKVGCAYALGDGAEIDKKKARHYYELAAMGGDADARHNLGNAEGRKGNMDRALKHFMIAVRNGYTGSMDAMRKLYSHGTVTKEDYTKALHSYQEYLGEIKSDQRDKAAAADEEFRYY